jgi:hypothetical protein
MLHLYLLLHQHMHATAADVQLHPANFGLNVHKMVPHVTVTGSPGACSSPCCAHPLCGLCSISLAYPSKSEHAPLAAHISVVKSNTGQSQT